MTIIVVKKELIVIIVEMKRTKTLLWIRLKTNRWLKRLTHNFN